MFNSTLSGLNLINSTQLLHMDCNCKVDSDYNDAKLNYYIKRTKNKENQIWCFDFNNSVVHENICILDVVVK